MKPYYEEKNDKISFRIGSRSDRSSDYDSLVALINKLNIRNVKFNNAFKEKVRKTSVKLK